jgi:hypothetical protein
MRYIQYRLATREGVLVRQQRYLTTKTRETSPWWKVWECNFDLDYEYTEWEDIEIPEIGPKV